MNSNPAGEPTITGTTDQFAGADVRADQDLAEQTGAKQTGGQTAMRRRTDDVTVLSAVSAGGVEGSGVSPGDVGPEVEVVLHAEQLLISRARYATERVRFAKQIVTTTRTIEVPVRIEQLVISHEPFPPDTPADGPAVTLAATPANTLVNDGSEAVAADAVAGAQSEGVLDVVIVLHEEVPEFTLRVTPVERVTIGIRTVFTEQTLTATLGSETVSVDQQQVDQMPTGQGLVDPTTH